jgi:hypothetical protein
MNQKKRKGCGSLLWYGSEIIWVISDESEEEKRVWVSSLFPLPSSSSSLLYHHPPKPYPEKTSLGKEFYVLVLHLGRLLFLIILVSLWNLLLLFELVEGIEGRDWRRRRAVSSVGFGGSERRTWLWNFSSCEQIFSWNYVVVVDGFWVWNGFDRQMELDPSFEGGFKRLKKKIKLRGAFLVFFLIIFFNFLDCNL